MKNYVYLPASEFAGIAAANIVLQKLDPPMNIREIFRPSGSQVIENANTGPLIY